MYRGEICRRPFMFVCEYSCRTRNVRDDRTTLEQVGVRTTMDNPNQHRTRREKRKQEQPPQKRRGLRVLIYIAFTSVFAYVSTVLWIFVGPFSNLRNYLIQSIDETRHAYLLRPLSLFTVSEATIKKYALPNNLSGPTIPIADLQHRDFSKIKDGTIKEITLQEPTFKAFILLVNDPKRIRVVATKYLHVRGETVQEMVSDTGAVAGINAGGFVDTNWQGTGAYPEGITITDGKLVSMTGSASEPQPVIAFTKEGQMIAGTYSLRQLQSLGIAQCVGFGPVLVENGKETPVAGQYDRNPRTAIGQTKDGTVILIVTDGRYATGPNDAGASYQDIADLMLKYHADIAANLDGGSSSTMVYQGKVLNRPVDILGERSVATSIVVMPEGGGSHG